MLELLRSLFARRCPARIDLHVRGWAPVRCDRRRHVIGEHVADRGMDEVRWTETVA